MAKPRLMVAIVTENSFPLVTEHFTNIVGLSCVTSKTLVVGAQKTRTVSKFFVGGTHSMTKER